MTKRTYQPKKRRTIRKLGFRARNSTRGGRAVLNRRRKKGRRVLTASDRYRLVGKSSEKSHS